MVILANNEGRFGHQLSQLAALWSYAKEYYRPFYYHGFEKTYGRILNKRHHEKPYVSNSTWMIGLLCFIAKILTLFRIKYAKVLNAEFYIQIPSQKHLLFDDDMKKMFLSKAKYVVTTHMFNDVHMLIKYRNDIRQILRPAHELEMKVNEYLAPIKERYSKLIGVHMRKSDFKDFENGRFYYNNVQYRAVMEQVLMLFEDAAFVLCSDEDVPVSDFEGLPCFFERRNFETDFFILEQCDVIIGPRSIYTMMANYLGGNRLYQIFDADKKIDREDFMDSDALLASRYDLKPVQQVDFDS